MTAREGRTLLLGLAAVVVGALLVAGCTGTGGTATPTPTAAPAAGNGTAFVPGDISGRLSVTGSTTVLSVAQALAEHYMAANAGAEIEISGGGSAVGITSVGEGTAGIGLSSRELKAAETAQYPDLRSIPIARDGLAMIVSPKNGVSRLTLAQIRGIYAGTITNWREVGGADRPVVPIGRDSASGTREFFDGKVMGTETTVRTMLEKNSNGAVQVSVAPNPNAIGYVGLGYLDPSVRAVELVVNGTAVAPTKENVIEGTYPLARELYFVTKGEATGLAQDFIAFALSDEGQGIVEDEGFVPVGGVGTARSA